jgi:hypothetical protein
VSRRYPNWVFGLCGLVCILALQLHFASAWTEYYMRFPLRGNGRAMAAGRVPPFLTTSTQSLLVGRVMLVSLPLITLWFRRQRRRAAMLALWAGVMLGLIIVWAGTPLLWGNLWQVGLVYLLFITGVPLLGGGLLQATAEKVTTHLSNTRD